MSKRKDWQVKDLLTGNKVTFVPILEEVETNTDGLRNPEEAKKEVECNYIEVTAKATDGSDIKLKFNYLDLYGFIYFIGNEDLRRQLALRYERDIVYMPYDVSFRVSDDEKTSGYAHRRIELPVDDVAMAMARAKLRVKEGMSQEDSDKELSEWRKQKISDVNNRIKEQFENK